MILEKSRLEYSTNKGAVKLEDTYSNDHSKLNNGKIEEGGSKNQALWVSSSLQQSQGSPKLLVDSYFASLLKNPGNAQTCKASQARYKSNPRSSKLPLSYLAFYF